MTLRIQSIEFQNFRNYRHFALSNLGQLTVLVGPNAVGKTNVLEGLHLLTALNSFRTATMENLIYHGSDQGFLTAHLSDGVRELDLFLGLEGHARRYRLNGKTKRYSDLKGLLPAVSFTPDDLDLVKGYPGRRRKMVDDLGSQLNGNYYLIRHDFEKVVRYKSKLLKEEASSELLDSIDELMIRCGAELTCYRMALFAKLIEAMTRFYKSITHHADEELSGVYVPSWEPVDQGDRQITRSSLAQALQQIRPEERRKKHTLIGPHTDAITFYLDGENASLYASQGQQRSIVLAEKLAEAQLIEEMLDQKPVLLLDDVMSELDELRRRSLVEFINDERQTVITTANLAYFDEKMLKQAQVIELDKTQ